MSRRRTRQHRLTAHFGPRRPVPVWVTFARLWDAIVASWADALAPIVDALTAVGRAMQRPARQDDYILAPPGDPA